MHYDIFIDEFSNLKLPRIIQIIDEKGELVSKLLDAKNPLLELNIGSTELTKIYTEGKISK